MLQEEVAKTGARGVCMGWGLKPGHSREVKKKKYRRKSATCGAGQCQIPVLGSP